METLKIIIGFILMAVFICLGIYFLYLSMQLSIEIKNKIHDMDEQIDELNNSLEEVKSAIDDLDPTIATVNKTFETLNGAFKK